MNSRDARESGPGRSRRIHDFPARLMTRRASMYLASPVPIRKRPALDECPGDASDRVCDLISRMREFGRGLSSIALSRTAKEPPCTSQPIGTVSIEIT